MTHQRRSVDPPNYVYTTIENPPDTKKIIPLTEKIKKNEIKIVYENILENKYWIAGRDALGRYDYTNWSPLECDPESEKLYQFKLLLCLCAIIINDYYVSDEFRRNSHVIDITYWNKNKIIQDIVIKKKKK